MNQTDTMSNVEFEQGYYKETIAETFARYMNDANCEKICPECDVLIAMPDKKKNYFEEAENIEGELKAHWLKTMSCFKNFSQYSTMQSVSFANDNFVKEQGDVALASYGIAPYLSRWSPYHGALYTVVLSLAKLVASGADYQNVQMDFEHYYDSMANPCTCCEESGEKKASTGNELAALLGAYEAKTGFGLADLKDQEAIEKGEAFLKECFKDSSIQPDFRAVAANTAKKENLIQTSFRRPDNKIVRFCIPYDKYDRPIYPEAMKTYKKFHKMVKNGYIQSAYAVGIGGTMEALAKMSYKNNYGVRIDEDIRLEQLSQKAYGAIVAEIKPRDIRYIEVPCMFLGEVIEEPVVEYLDEVIELDELYEV